MKTRQSIRVNDIRWLGWPSLMPESINRFDANKTSTSPLSKSIEGVKQALSTAYPYNLPHSPACGTKRSQIWDASLIQID
jgi:hypothetical protein